jgi:ABC-type glycerol-3-phosphate transport system substrate-binding protein
MRFISLTLNRYQAVTLVWLGLTLLLAACEDNGPATQPPAKGTVVTTTVTSGATTSSNTTNSTTLESPTTSSNSGSSKTKVTFWSNQRHDQPLMKTEVDQFNRENPDNI